MSTEAILKWKDNQVGCITDITMDMWYLEGNWLPNQSNECFEFENVASILNETEILENPLKGIVVSLQYNNSSQIENNYCLVISLSKDRIFLRIIRKESAAYLDLNILTPWMKVKNPLYFENELRREISFFHPLYWKKIKAIGNRIDCDDVLFEVSNSKKYKFSIVHLTFTKKRSSRFPLSTFYKNWDEVYHNRLIKDNQQYSEDLM